MNRADLQRVALMRVRDSKVLLDNRRYAAAYYLAGYAVECGLKACIARQVRSGEFPPSARYWNDVFTHDLERLVGLAGLGDARRSFSDVSELFKRNWSVVQNWSEQARYEDRRSRKEAKSIFDAVTSETDGVLEWIKQHW